MDEMVARSQIERKLLASIGRKGPYEWFNTAEERELARNAAHAIYLRDERIKLFESYLRTALMPDASNEAAEAKNQEEKG